MRGSFGAILSSLLLGAACNINPLFDPAGGTDSSTGTTAAATGAATTAPATTGDGAIVVGQLEAAWGTPAQIRWAWEATGEPDDLVAYELVVAESEGDVLARRGTARVWTEAENPELGRFLLPRTGGEDPVVATVTDGLEPDRIYHAQLIAIDTAGETTVSNVAAGRTTPAALDEIVLYADEEPSGFPLPESFRASNDGPYAGDAALRYESICSDSGECWENLRWQEMSVDLSRISEGSYATTAFLELALAVDGNTTPWWCGMWVWYDGSSADHLAHYNGWTARADRAYRVLQVPLRVFLENGSPPPFEDLQAFGIYGWNVGCPWEDGSIVRVDEVRIRW